MKKSARVLGTITAAVIALGGAANVQGASAAPTGAQGPAIAQTATRTMSVTKALYPSSRKLTVGQTASYTGKVTTGPRGTKVFFQHYGGGRWVTIGTSTVSSTGAFKVSARPSAPGVRKVRLVIGGNSTYKTYYGYPNTLTVYRWRYLYEMKPASGYLNHPGGVMMNGTFYARSIYVDGSRSDAGSVSQYDWALGRKCSKLAFTTGIDDSAESGTVRELFETWGDTVRLSSTITRYGQTNPMQVSVDGVLRLSLRMIDIDNHRYDYKPAFGNARVLCAS